MPPSDVWFAVRRNAPLMSSAVCFTEAIGSAVYNAEATRAVARKDASNRGFVPQRVRTLSQTPDPL